MHCWARNIERLIRILKLRTDLRSRFVACSFPLKSEINELPPGPLLAVLSAINNDCVFAQARSVVNRQCSHRPADWYRDVGLCESISGIPGSRNRKSTVETAF